MTVSRAQWLSLLGARHVLVSSSFWEILMTWLMAIHSAERNYVSYLRIQAWTRSPRIAAGYLESDKEVAMT